MSLKATLRRAVKAAFTAFDDVPRKCIYSSVSGAPVRDFEAGTLVYPSTPYTLPMVVFARFTQWETDKDPALLTAMKMIYPSADLPVDPKPMADTVTDDQGTLWTIVKRISDPASVVTILMVRAS